MPLWRPPTSAVRIGDGTRDGVLVSEAESGPRRFLVPIGPVRMMLATGVPLVRWRVGGWG